MYNKIIRQSSWIGEDIIKNDIEWRFQWSIDEIIEISEISDKIVNKYCDSNNDILLINNLLADLTILELIKSSKFSKKLLDITDRLVNGIGFCIISSLPIRQWGKLKSSITTIVIGLSMGRLCKQNAQGHVLGHVRDLGLRSSDPNVRVYQTNERQTFHTDSCDIVGLLCLNKAISGGESSVVSSETIFNEMLEKYPDLLHELLQPLPTDRRGEIPLGQLPYYNIPVFNYYKDNLSVLYQRQYIDSSQRFEDAPRLTSKQIEALNQFDSLANDNRLNISMYLQPGDIQFIHNHNMLHDRSEFIDDMNNKRHLLRIWISPSIGRELPDCFTERFGSITIGDRGGINIEGVIPIAPLV